MGSVWGDFDNDGWEDVLVYKYGRPELFRNVDGRSFVPVGERAGLPSWVNANSATWLDYDRDGHLDLFIAGYWPDDVNLWKLETTKIMPESFEYATNGGRKYLLRNRGDGTFEDRTEAMGIRSHRWTLAVTAADLLGTGYPDLFLANDYGVSELFANRGGKRFEDVAEATGVGVAPKSGMNASVGDVFNDGRLAIYKTNITEPGQLLQGNDLWVPQSVAQCVNVREPGVDPGDRSGRLELGRSVRRSEQRRHAGYLPDQRLHIGRGAQQLLVRLRRDCRRPQHDHRRRGELAGDERAQLLRLPAETAVGERRRRPPHRRRAGGWREGHLRWPRGRARRSRQPRRARRPRRQSARPAAHLPQHRGAGRHWIQFELEGTGNRSAIGARVELHWAGHVQAQMVAAATGFSAQNQRRVHYGLGAATSVDRVVIRWPSGQTQTIEHPAVDRLHRVKEEVRLMADTTSGARVDGR